MPRRGFGCFRWTRVNTEFQRRWPCKSRLRSHHRVTSYLQVMRRLQSVYMLEPAGSHGVWGLDDYHCLPFLWGSAQLIDHPTIRPQDVLDEGVLEEG